ncbi:MAG TPA: hypothetical protein GX504_08980 [Clostridia bacterium]|nr:hypothetical protein [Clostridia bacterium]
MAEPKFSIRLPQLQGVLEGGSNTRLYVLLGILAVLSVVAVVVNLSLFRTSGELATPAALPGEQAVEDLPEETASLLPQLTRQEEESVAGLGSAYVEGIDPFALPMELHGVVTGGKKDVAIVKARHTTYIVSTGEQVAGGWELVEIKRDSVRLSNGAEEIVLGLRAAD